MKPFSFCTGLAILVSACGGSPSPQPVTPTLSSATAQPPGWPELGQGNARFIRVDLGPDSFRECQRISPKFPFDSAAAYAQDREQIVALAQCLNAPSMRERSVVLVGHADSQGSEHYNDDLGMKRAKAIQGILVEGGLAASRIDVATEGKKGAVGEQPDYSPGYDRRVDILVKGGTHAP